MTAPPKAVTIVTPQPPAQPIRLRCLECNKLMPHSLWMQTEKRWSRPKTTQLIDPQGYFCRLRCAAQFGVRTARDLYPNGQPKPTP